MDDDFDSDDSSDSGESSNSDSDVSPEKFTLSSVFQTAELRLHTLAQSSYSVFDKHDNVDLQWYGFDKNGKLIYAVLCFNSEFDEFHRIVKYSHVTSGFYIVKRLEAGSKVLGFDEANGLFLIVKVGTTPTIVLYNVTSDNEIAYQCKEKYDFAPFFQFSKSFPITERNEWLLFGYDTNSYHPYYFRRLLFNKGDKYISLSAAIIIPQNTFNLRQVFMFDKDTLIFVNTWKKVLVYNIEIDQFFIENFRVPVVPDYHTPQWYMNLTCSKVFFGFSQTYGFLKLDFSAKKWRSIKNISLPDNPADLLQPLTSGNIGTCVISDANCTILAVPNNGCLCAVYGNVFTKYLFEKELKTDAGVRPGFRLRAYEKRIRIACFLPSQWSSTLQDLCVKKLFEDFRKNGKIADGEFCRQIGISSDLIQTYIGTSV